ncbi:unnamed protein product [Rhizoctonia solani]|uniref:Uncharacterized protein n=1 Tax=Rhizoctonia solani TaxID=456999 RepID=A0A8H3E2S6_9AGAM|nr:unnamed protein product [Rhizoctonia solani]
MWLSITMESNLNLEEMFKDPEFLKLASQYMKPPNKQSSLSDSSTVLRMKRRIEVDLGLGLGLGLKISKLYLVMIATLFSLLPTNPLLAGPLLKNSLHLMLAHALLTPRTCTLVGNVMYSRITASTSYKMVPAIHTAAFAPPPVVAATANANAMSRVRAPPVNATKFLAIAMITVTRAHDLLIEILTPVIAMRIVTSGQTPTAVAMTDGWNNKKYYHRAQASYETGGKDGDRAGNKRGGPVMVYNENNEKVKYKTLLEYMKKEEKYRFVKEHNHPFVAVAGIPYFNPYGKVPLDGKLTAIIPKTEGPLFISSGQRLDFEEYLEGRAVVRAAVSRNIPDNATLKSGQFLTWTHYGLSVRLQIYNYVYSIKPYYYHFRDVSGENNWLIDSEVKEYLKEIAGYLRKNPNIAKDPIAYLCQLKPKNTKKVEAQTPCINEPDTENPYYLPMFGADKKYAGSIPKPTAPTKPAIPTSSSTNARDARRADRIVALEEARAKDEAHATKPAKPAKPAKQTGSLKAKTKSKASHCVEPSDESDDEGPKLAPPPKPKRKATTREPESDSEEDLEEPEPPANESIKKLNKVKSKQHKEASPDAEIVQNKKLDRIADKEPKAQLVNGLSLAKERARMKMRPRPETQSRQGEDAVAVVSEDSPPDTDHPLDHGFRVVKKTKMMVKPPVLGTVASRTRSASQA